MADFNEHCIHITFFGGQADVTYAEWADQWIQDESVAEEIAREMLEIGDISPYCDNSSDSGARPEFYCEYEITNVEKFKKQMGEFNG